MDIPKFRTSTSTLDPPLRQINRLLSNLALLFVSVALFLTFCELVVFRLIFLPSDVPHNAFIEGVIRYVPEQSGIWRVKDEIHAPFAINRQGWNSAHAEYRRARTPGVDRIVIIGDSYVEALQVPVERSLAEQLEHRLESVPTEVYRLGISGAPLSQYLHMFEREAIQYAPDLVVLVLVHNDFNESFQFASGRITSSFLKLRLAQGRVREEILPTPYMSGPWDWLRFSATSRYLYYRQQAAPIVSRLLSPAQAAAADHQANINIDEVLPHITDIEAAIDYLFGRLSGVAREQKLRLLILMNGDFETIYQGLGRSEVMMLNDLAASMALRHQIAFIDLYPRFQQHWRDHHMRFNFEVDAHWNELGHDLVAGVIEEFVRHGK